MIAPTVTLPEKAAPRKDYWLTRSEVAARLRRARKHAQTRHICRVLLIGVYSGTRPGAILGLRWLPSPAAGWVDLKSGTIHRAGTAERQSKKRKPPARIHTRLLPHLRRWKRVDADAGISFVVHYGGQPINKLRRAWATIGGGKDAPHICRHTAMQAGVDLYEASGYLGMTPETLWSTYGHHHPEFQETAASALSKRPRRAQTARSASA
jgi:integrase